MVVSKFNELSQMMFDVGYLDTLTQAYRENLKVAFNFGAPLDDQDKQFEALYNQWASKRQLAYIKNAKLQLMISVLNPNLTEDQSLKKLVHTSLISKLRIRSHAYGFEGELILNIPYDQQKENIWADILFKNNILKLDICYQEDVLKQGKYSPNTKNKWQITGVINLASSNSRTIVEKYFNYPYQQEPKKYYQCRIRFVDAFNFLGKQHYPVEVHTKASYKTVFEQHFQKWKALCNISIKSGIDAFESVRPWICLNCSFPKVSFYDLLLRTLAHYHLAICYQYDSATPSLVIADLAQEKLPSSESLNIELGNLDNITWQQGNVCLSDREEANHYWVNQSSVSSQKVMNKNFNNAPFELKIIDYCPTNQFHQTAIKSRNYLFESFNDELEQIDIALKYFPSTGGCFPGNLISMPQAYQGKDNSKVKSFIIKEADIEFTNYQSNTNFVGENSVLKITPKSKSIEADEYHLEHGLTIGLKAYAGNKWQCNYPEFCSDDKKLKIYAWISDCSTNTQDNQYFLGQRDSAQSFDITSSSKSKNNAYDPMYRVNDTELSYIVSLPAAILSPQSKQTSQLEITLPFFLNNDHILTPLRKGTPVEIELYQESGSIQRIFWHSMENKLFSKDTQFNKITLGNKDSAALTHSAPSNSLGEGELELYARTDQSIAQLLSTKDSLSFTFKNNKESK